MITFMKRSRLRTIRQLLSILVISAFKKVLYNRIVECRLNIVKTKVHLRGQK